MEKRRRCPWLRTRLRARGMGRENTSGLWAPFSSDVFAAEKDPERSPHGTEPVEGAVARARGRGRENTGARTRRLLRTIEDGERTELTIDTRLLAFSDQDTFFQAVPCQASMLGLVHAFVTKLGRRPVHERGSRVRGLLARAARRKHDWPWRGSQTCPRVQAMSSPLLHPNARRRLFTVEEVALGDMTTSQHLRDRG